MDVESSSATVAAIPLFAWPCEACPLAIVWVFPVWSAKETGESVAKFEVIKRREQDRKEVAGRRYLTGRRNLKFSEVKAR